METCESRRMKGRICSSMRATACMRWLGSMTMRRISPARVPITWTSAPGAKPATPESGNRMRSVIDGWNQSLSRPALMRVPANRPTQSSTTAILHRCEGLGHRHPQFRDLAEGLVVDHHEVRRAEKGADAGGAHQFA